jgi:translocation and assembly module TamB
MALFLIIVISLQFTAVQNLITGRLTSWLSSETGTVISIDRVAIRFPKSIGLRGVYAEDENGDTLLYAGNIFANIRMTSLLQNKVLITSLELDELTARVIRQQPDSVFNFQFIADAFASDEDIDTPDSDQESSFEFRINNINLNNINILFEDHHSGIQLISSLHHFSTDMSESDLLNQQYHIGETELTGGNIDFRSYEPTFPPDTAEQDPSEMSISLKSLTLNDFALIYDNTEGTSLDLKTSVLRVIPETINLADYLIAISYIQAENLITSIIQPDDDTGNEMKINGSPGDGNLPEEQENGELEFGFNFSEIMEWTITIDNIEITSSYLSLTNDGEPVSATEFDPSRFSLGNFNLFAGNIIVGPRQINLNVDSLSMLISDRFAVDNLILDMTIDSSSSEINLDFISSESRIVFELGTEADLLNFTSETIANKNFELDLGNSHIKEDLAYFIPAMRSYYFNWPGNQGIEFGGGINGSMASMTVDSLWISGPGFFSTFADGTIKGINTDITFLDLERFNLYAVPGRILENLPDTLRPEGITIPEYVNIDGRLAGTTGNFETSLGIETDFGNIEIAGSLFEESEEETGFEGRVYTASFDFGRMFQLEILPVPPSVNVNFKGRGLAPEDMELVAEITLDNLALMDYVYHDLVMNIHLADSVVKADGNYKDDLLAFGLGAELGLFKEINFAKGRLNIDYADLFRLGFAGEELLVESDISADIVFYPEDFFSGEILISNSSILANGELIKLDEISFISESVNGDYRFDLDMGFLTAGYSGNFTPFDIQGIITDHISGYFDTIPDAIPEGSYEHFDLELAFHPEDLLRMFVPELITDDTLIVNVKYDSRLYEITLEASIDDFVYSDMEFYNLAVNAASDPGVLDFNVNIESLNLNENIFYDIDLSGGFFEGILDLAFSLKDAEQDDIISIGVKVERPDDLYLVSVDSDRLVINKDEWKVNPDNLVIVGDKFLMVSDLILESGESLISFTSLESDIYSNVIQAIFNEVDLGEMTSFVENGIPPITGILNGDITLRDVFEEPSFIASLNIEDLSLSGDTLGNLSLTANNPAPDNYYINLTAENEGTDIRVEGNYFAGEEPAVELEVYLERLNLALAEVFAGGNVTNISGFLTGNMVINGPVSSPEITGVLNINETGFRVPALNAEYFLRDERIVFDKQTINLPNFTLEDSQGRNAQVNGSVNISDFENIALSIDLSTRDFLLMNLPERRGEMYHGHILVDSDLRLRGSHLSPSLVGRLRLNEGSNFTFVLPQDDPEAIGAEGVVEFIHPGDTLFLEMAERRTETEELTAPIQTMNIDLNLEIDSETVLRLVIDDIAGDFLEVQGGGVLNFGIDPGGKITLAGRYDIVEGEYLLTFYDIITRNFDIASGSSILWTGDPLDAQLDITAIYTHRTSARELMRTHSGTDQARSAALRQQFPFLVSLSMEGNLMAPDISFDLGMPREYQNAMDGAIMQRIEEINQNESELNKQVFALLILGSFLQENPLDFAGGPGIGATARSSGSQILTQQLNRMSDRYIRGVDINFELESYEDFSDGEAAGRTELQMEVSRDFFDDRFRVTVGGNIELEDETRRETNAADIAGDFSLEYLLTPEGEFIIRGFRNRDFGDLIERDIVETGVALRFSKSFDRFRDIFRRNLEDLRFPDPEEEIIDEQVEVPEIGTDE